MKVSILEMEGKLMQRALDFHCDCAWFFFCRINLLKGTYDKIGMLQGLVCVRVNYKVMYVCELITIIIQS